MARSDAVWGIDIGQCALKALRCRPHADPTLVTAAAFDYIEYPKLLSQPDADAPALVHDALKQFLSRNSVRGDRVIIAVSGQSGLARFIKLPPVETSRIPDIVKYEARQQIPFALEDVVWDFQQMVGGMVVEGFAMETEVGLFAMKRDQVYRALKPYMDAGIEVDAVQLTPLALYNFVAFDQMQNLPPGEEYDPERPPESVVLLSLGTETTDLVVTNGFRVWQRSIPIGGNHFTKALTKELKLTFASAEHTKRNAAQAEDPKAIFQAMRPVFNDLHTEVQRSISYFSNLDRKARIGRVVALGNAMKLPGLQRYLAQNMGFDVTRLDSFRGLTGSDVLDAPAFKENVPAFGVCYGLALQGLKDTKIKTNLLPHEIIQQRLVRAKKPWAVGAAAALLLGFGISYLSYWQARQSVRQEGYFAGPVAEVTTVVGRAKTYESAFKAAMEQFGKTSQVGRGLTQNEAGHDVWMKVLRAISLALPRDEGERPAEIVKRNEIHLESIESVRKEDLKKWYAGVKDFDEQLGSPAAKSAAPDQPVGDQASAVQPADGDRPADGSVAAATNPAAGNTATTAEAASTVAQPDNANTTANSGANTSESPPANAEAAAAAPTGPTGPGFVFTLKGYHLHNVQGDMRNFGIEYLKDTILASLRQDEISIPLDERIPGGLTTFPIKKLGIGYPVLINLNTDVDWKHVIEVEDLGDGDAGAEGGANAAGGGNMPGGAAGGNMPGGGGAGGGNMAGGGGKMGGGGMRTAKTKKVPAPRYDFTLQFCWQELPRETLATLAAPPPKQPEAVNNDAAEPVAGDAAGDVAGDAAGQEAPLDQEAAVEAAAEPVEPLADGATEAAAEQPVQDAQPPVEEPIEAAVGNAADAANAAVVPAGAP